MHAAAAPEEPTARPSMREALERVGPEILGFLVATLRDPVAGRDVYALFCEDFWKGYDAFRGDSSVRTWAYVLARHAALRWQRSQPPAHVPLSQTSELPHRRSVTAPHLATTMRSRLERARAALDPDDQTLLILRIDRELGWSEVAEVFVGPLADADAIAKKAAALRKRFERLKAELLEQLQSEAR